MRRLHHMRTLTHSELGNDLWRQNPINRHYDYKQIHSRLQALIEAEDTGDVQALTYIIRSGTFHLRCNGRLVGLLRNLGNIAAKSLYNRAYAGCVQYLSF